MENSICTEELASQKDRVQIVDVRRRPDFYAASKMIPRAVWHDPEDLAGWAGKLDRTRPVVVYCAHGRQVSQGCAQALGKAGFDAHFLEGGFEKWAGEGKPIVPKLGPASP